jgi:hypothetical protein
MSLWKPAADPGTVGMAAMLGDRLAGGLSPEAPKLSTLVSTGWSGPAAGQAAGESGTLGKLLSGFCDTTSQAAGVMRAFAQSYGELKARFDRLDADHTAAQHRVGALDRSIAAYQGRTLTPADQTQRDQLVGHRDHARGEIARLEAEHRQTMTEFQTAQQRTAGQLDGLTPKGLTGSPSQQSAQVRAMVFKQMPSVREEEGRRLGQRIREDLKNNGAASIADVDELAANADDPDYVKGLYAALGPEGVAALSRQAKQTLASQYGDEHSDGRKLFDALSTSVKVAADENLITDDWLNRFDPKNALPSELYHDDVNGFRADLLIPLTAGKKLPSDVMQLIGNRAFADLKSGMDSGTPMMMDKWGAYVGGDAGSDPYQQNLMKGFLGDLAKDPMASNAVLMRNFDTLQRIGRGGLVDDITDQIGDNLSKTVEAGVLGVADLDHDGHRDTGPGAQGFLGDALMSRLVLDTADHPKDHYEDFYRKELGGLVTNERYFENAMYSVTTMPPGGMPGTSADWIDGDNRRWHDGIELDPSAWAAMHQEVMADPGTAAKLIKMTHDSMADASAQLSSMVPPGGHGADPSLQYSAAIARNQMHHFLIGNLDGAHDRLQEQLTEITGNEETAKGAVTKIIGWATEPNKIVSDLKGTAIDKSTDWLVHQAYSGQEQNVQGALDGLRHERDTLQADRLNSSPQIYQDSANGLTTRPDQIAPVQVVQSDGQVVTYTGNPHDYIDKYSKTEYGQHGPIHHDANFLDANNKPVPLEQIEADPDKLRAYEEWLHDPAVQKQTRQAVEATIGADHP